MEPTPLTLLECCEERQSASLARCSRELALARRIWQYRQVTRQSVQEIGMPFSG